MLLYGWSNSVFECFGALVTGNNLFWKISERKVYAWAQNSALQLRSETYNGQSGQNGKTKRRVTMKRQHKVLNSSLRHTWVPTTYTRGRASKYSAKLGGFGVSHDRGTMAGPGWYSTGLGFCECMENTPRHYECVSWMAVPFSNY